jgi:predicted Fe-S protein YdhL (DUF1289 family)
VICDFRHLPDQVDERGRHPNVCQRCGRIVWNIYPPVQWVGKVECQARFPRPREILQWISGALSVPRPSSPPPQDGPGSELKKMFDALGIQATSTCQCATRMAEMNTRGVEGCRRTREEILVWMRESYDEAGVLTILRAGANAVAQGLPLTLEGLLELAIERAEAKASDARDRSSAR